MVFKGNYLRVSTPRTTDGVTPLMQNDRLVYKEDFLPLSAEEHLRKQNEKLPEILKKKIEVVKNDENGTPVPVVKAAIKK
jgi:hypothetical protein